MANEFDTNRVHVRAPTTVVLLCGGPTTRNIDEALASLRDAFWKMDFPPTSNKLVLKAEDVTQQFDFSAHYDNLLDFETDLAQLVELIILFCESGGSLAELGAFSFQDEIAKRLFVVICESHAIEPSFIKLGPLRKLEKLNDRKSIFVLNEGIVNFTTARPDLINKDALKKELLAPIRQLLECEQEPTTFDKSISGHITKLIVGLIQEYGALTSVEIIQLLSYFGVHIDDSILRKKLLCAKSIEWIDQVSKGSFDYIVAGKNISAEAATIHLIDTAKEKDRARRRFIIRQHWEKNDPHRYRAIIRELSGTAA